MACGNNCVGCKTNVEVPNEPEVDKLVDRFDLEQQILQCWNITDDLKESDDEYIKAVRVIYEKKFEKLWEMFEELVSAKKLT